MAGNVRKQIEPVAKQPFKGIVIEIVRTWRDQSGQSVADYRYQARQGTAIIATGQTHDKICAVIADILKRRGQPAAPARPPTWLERLTGKRGRG